MTEEKREARVRCGKHWLTSHKFVHHAHPHSSNTKRPKALKAHRVCTASHAPQIPQHRSPQAPQLRSSAGSTADTTAGTTARPTALRGGTPHTGARREHIESQLCQLCMLMRTLERGTPVDDIHRMSRRADREWNGTCFRLSSMATPALPS